MNSQHALYLYGYNSDFFSEKNIEPAFYQPELIKLSELSNFASARFGFNRDSDVAQWSEHSVSDSKVRNLNNVRGLCFSAETWDCPGLGWQRFW